MPFRHLAPTPSNGFRNGLEGLRPTRTKFQPCSHTQAPHISSHPVPGAFSPRLRTQRTRTSRTGSKFIWIPCAWKKNKGEIANLLPNPFRKLKNGMKIIWRYCIGISKPSCLRSYPPGGIMQGWSLFSVCQLHGGP